MKRKPRAKKLNLLQYILAQCNIAWLPKKIVIQAGQFHMTIDWNEPKP